MKILHKCAQASQAANFKKRVVLPWYKHAIYVQNLQSIRLARNCNQCEYLSLEMGSYRSVIVDVMGVIVTVIDRTENNQPSRHFSINTNLEVFLMVPEIHNCSTNSD